MKRGIGIPILCLCLILAAFPVVAARGVSAQTGPPDVPLLVNVSTDKPVYAPGEAIRIRVSATNLLDTEQVLQFSSGKVADYVINGAYRWSDDKAFTLETFKLRIGPRETHSFREFVHEASAHALEPDRRHEIVGEVVGYGRASTTIFVSTAGPTPRFELTPAVRPNPAPFGAVINFAVSVRNVTDQTLTFGHSGCPVLFRIDGQDMPPVPCPEYWKRVTLAPGQSIRFGPEDYPYLSLGSDRNAFYLPAGVHRVDFQIPGVGTTAARFQVLPGPGGGAITGHVTGVDGTVIAGATIQAFSPSQPDSSPNSAFVLYQAYSGRDGSYRIESIPGGRYIVRAFTSNSDMVWYDQVATRDLATPVPVTEGGVTAAIDFILKRGPEPPPYPGWIFGSVSESITAAGNAVPVPGAVVAAFPLGFTDRDSGGPGVPPPGDVLPPLPPEGPGVFFGFVDDTGEFRISVPYGAYRLMAFAEGHRYQWYQRAETFDGSIPYEVMPNQRQAPAHFILTPIHTTAMARIAGIVKGVSLSTDAASAILEPLAGAEVSARPLVLDPRIAYFAEVVYRARTGDNGVYGVDVPPTIPYIVDAQHKGYVQQYYDHASDRSGARPVDVFVGPAPQPVERINFDLRIDGIPPPPPRPGVISGFVYSDNGTDGPLRPLPGAVVRIRTAEDYPVPHERITRTDSNGRYLFSGLSTVFDTPPRYIVSAEADGHVPNYYPGVYQWTTAQPVEPVPAEARVVTNLTLYQPMGRTPFFTVGFVRTRNESGVPPPDDGDSTGTGFGTVVPAAARSLIESAEMAVLDEPLGPHPLPGAYFYLFPADALGPVDPQPMAGGVTTANGTAVVENLPSGVYRAYADRPGFLVGWFGGVGGTGLITVGEGHAPVLAGILMSLMHPPPGPPTQDAGNRMVRDLHNAPNPFRPQTTIMYQLGAAADVTLNIFDVNGRLVRTLVNRARQFPGQQLVPWDGRDASGSTVGAGIYFYRVETPLETTVGKMVLAR